MRTRRFLVSLLSLAAAFCAWAGPYGTYYRNLPAAVAGKMVEPRLPAIPDNSVSLTEFGGVGDGITDNTQAFAKAISALQKQGGGHLVVPAGVFVTASSSPGPSP